MQSRTDAVVAGRSTALWHSTIAFALCFAMWTIFATVGVHIRPDLGLCQTEFGLLVGLLILRAAPPHVRPGRSALAAFPRAKGLRISHLHEAIARSDAR